MLYNIDSLCEMLDVWKNGIEQVDYLEAFEYLEALGSDVIDLVHDLGLPHPDCNESGWPFPGDHDDDEMAGYDGEPSSISSSPPPLKRQRTNAICLESQCSSF